MAKVSPIQQAFNAGEFGPTMYGRVDVDKYANAVGLCLNWLPMVEGPLTRRPGTRYVAAVKDSTALTRVLPFSFSTEQAYILEFGNLYFRIYKDHGQVESGGSPVEVVTPWTTAQVPDLSYTQSADVLFVVHPAHKPRKISRTSHIAWTVSEVDLLDGPYLNVNSTDTTLTPSGGSYGEGASPTVTASAVTGINGGAGFATTDVGRLVRIKNGDDWAWGEITARASTTQVTVLVRGGTFPSAATKFWRLGLFSDTTGWPAVVTFFQDRLVFGGSTPAPQRIDGSRTGDYENFAPTEQVDGTVTDSNAISFTLNSKDVQVIRWMEPVDKGLLVGTSGGEWSVRASATNEAVTPTNVKADQATRRGSARSAAVAVGSNAVVFIQATRRKLREMAWDFYADNFKTGNANKFASHMPASGIKEIAYQQEPQAIVWAPRNDGVLLGLTFEKDEAVMGWHRHVLGGPGDSSGGIAQIESVAVIPEPNGTYDELWMVVKRYINGATRRYVEYLGKVYDSGDLDNGYAGDEPADACYLDCAVVYDGSAATTISGIAHLEGETVGVWADGAPVPDETVTGGAITLANAASKVAIGYHCRPKMRTLRNNSGAADGTAQGKTQRIHNVTVRLHKTGTLRAGRDFDHMELVTERVGADLLGVPPPLRTGDYFIPWEGEYTTESLICFDVPDASPATLVAIMPQQVTQDRG